MIERSFVESVKFTVLVFVAASHLRHGADATDRRNAVADGAACPIKCRSEAVFRGLYFAEVFEAGAEKLELHRRDVGKRTAGNNGRARLT